MIRQWIDAYKASQLKPVKAEAVALATELSQAESTADEGQRLLRLDDVEKKMSSTREGLSGRFATFAERFHQAGKLFGATFGGIAVGLIPATLLALPATTFLGAIGAGIAIFGSIGLGMWGGQKLMRSLTYGWADRAHSERFDALYSTIDNALPKISMLKNELLGKGLAAFSTSSAFETVQARFPKLTSDFVNAALRRNDAPVATPVTAVSSAPALKN